MSEFEDITPEPPRMLRWACSAPDCGAWCEGNEEMVIYSAEQHALTAHPTEAPPDPNVGAPEPDPTPEPEPEPEPEPTPDAPVEVDDDLVGEIPVIPEPLVEE